MNVNRQSQSNHRYEPIVHSARAHVQLRMERARSQKIKVTEPIEIRGRGSESERLFEVAKKEGLDVAARLLAMGREGLIHIVGDHRFSTMYIHKGTLELLTQSKPIYDINLFVRHPHNSEKLVGFLPATANMEAKLSQMPSLRVMEEIPEMQIVEEGQISKMHFYCKKQQ